MILKEFNMHVPEGSVVALCGESGSGKSTIGQLIEGFYQPYSGIITIDGHLLSSIDPNHLRRHIGYINQEPVLFSGTIYENIKYGNVAATDEQVFAAAKLAKAHDFITGFPEGYNTQCGERGITLSGGQKQRISIARALLQNPKILILDEATSALDPQTENFVQNALVEVMKDRTVVIIAHRLSTIKNADQIIVMGHSTAANEGNVLEMGTHTSLLKNKGSYYRAYTANKQ